jgi:HK97 gp10 family phage protein
MTVTLKLENTQAVAKALAEYGAKAEKAIADAVNGTAIEVASDIKRAIQRGPKTGRVYVRRGIEHQASAGGEAPATDTGTLVSSIVYRKTGPIEAEIESRLPYASYLEFGTQRMAARPSWTPAAEKAKPKFADRVARAIAGLSK